MHRKEPDDAATAKPSYVPWDSEDETLPSEQWSRNRTHGRHDVVVYEGMVFGSEASTPPDSLWDRL